MKKIIILFLVSIISIKTYSQEIDKQEKIKYYGGIILGLPNDLNPSVGINYKNYVFRLSGGAWFSNKYGAQLDLIYIFSSSKNFQHNLLIISGYSHNRKIINQSFFSMYDVGGIYYSQNNDSFYFGPAYSISWNGLFIQIGSAWGTGNFEKPKMVSFIGYTFSL